MPPRQPADARPPTDGGARTHQRGVGSLLGAHRLGNRRIGRRQGFVEGLVGVIEHQLRRVVLGLRLRDLLLAVCANSTQVNSQRRLGPAPHPRPDKTDKTLEMPKLCQLKQPHQILLLISMAGRDSRCFGGGRGAGGHALGSVAPPSAAAATSRPISTIPRLPIIASNEPRAVWR